MILIAVVVVVLLGAYSAWRYKKHKVAQEQYGRLMPPSRHLSWKAPTALALRNSVSLMKGAAAGSSGGRAAAFPQFPNDLLRQLDSEERDVLARIPSSGFWGVLFPSDNDLDRGGDPCMV